MKANTSRLASRSSILGIDLILRSASSPSPRERGGIVDTRCGPATEDRLPLAMAPRGGRDYPQIRVTAPNSPGVPGTYWRGGRDLKTGRAVSWSEPRRTVRAESGTYGWWVRGRTNHKEPRCVQSVTLSPRPRAFGRIAFGGCSRVRFRTGTSTALQPSSDSASTGCSWNSTMRRSDAGPHTQCRAAAGPEAAT